MKKTIITIIITFICLAIIFLVLQRHSLKIVKTWEQDKNIKYDDWGPYYLHVVEANSDLGYLPLSMPRNYFIYAGRDKIKISYGHIKKYSFEYNQNIREYLNACIAQWQKNGIYFVEPSGHTLFIPKNSFTGGR